MSSRTDVIARRIGLLIPSSNTVMEPDFNAYSPSGWTVHAARMFLEETTADAEEHMLDNYVFPAARDIATAKPHVIVFGCTSAGALRGNDYDSWLTQEIAERTSIPTISVINSVQKKLLRISAAHVVVVTPYVAFLNKRIQESLQDENIQVLKIEGMGISDNLEIGQVQGKKILDLSYQAVGTLNPDALFISCTNLPAMGVLPTLQEHFPFTVVTSNQAALETAIEVARTIG